MGLWAMLKSPQISASRPEARKRRRCSEKRPRKSIFTAWRASPLVPEGRYSEITDSVPKRASR